MTEPTLTKTRVIGIGDPMRGDDGVGAAVIDALRGTTLPGDVDLSSMHGEGTELMQAWEGFDWIILVDAANAHSSLGNVHYIDAIRSPVPSDLLRLSTHEFGPAQAAELARALGNLPTRLDIYAVEGRDFTLGSGLSSAIRRAVDEVASVISYKLVLGLVQPRQASQLGILFFLFHVRRRGRYRP